MIDLLTLPVATDPTAPAAPIPAAGDAALIDFAALLGEAAPAVTPTISLAPEAVTPQLPTAETPVVPVVVSPTADIIAQAPAPETPVAVTAPAVAAAIVAPVTMKSEELPEAEPVKLPTLPVGFFAQRMPASAKVAKATAKPAEPQKDEAEGSTEEAAPEAPLQTIVLAAVAEQPQPASPPVAPMMAAPVETAAPQAALVDAPVSKTAPKAEAPVFQPVTQAAQPNTVTTAAPQPEQVASVVAAVEVKATTVDAAAPQAPAAAVTPDAPAVFAEAFALQQPTPVQPTQAAPVAAPVQTVILDDLYVAGASDSAWLDRLATDITTLASGNAREAHMTINPRSLGEMSIKLEVEGQHARVHFTVDTPQALSLMADGAPRLAQMVEANGFKLDGATVDLDQRRDGRAQSDAQQQQQQDQPSRGLPRAREEVARLIQRTRIATATERFA